MRLLSGVNSSMYGQGRALNKLFVAPRMLTDVWTVAGMYSLYQTGQKRNKAIEVQLTMTGEITTPREAFLTRPPRAFVHTRE